MGYIALADAGLVAIAHSFLTHYTEPFWKKGCLFS